MSSVNSGSFGPIPDRAPFPVVAAIPIDAAPVPAALHRVTRGFDGPPAIVAHRGASALAPENTLAAIRLALALGADAVECDVFLSADGVPVLMHDESLLRTTGVDAPVASLTAAELARLDAGSWKAPRYAAERVPTLVDALRLLGGEIPLLIELKHPHMEAEVVAALNEAGASRDDVVIYARDFDSLRRLVQLDASVQAAVVVEEVAPHGEAWRELTELAASTGARGLAVDRELTTAERVAAAHEAGLWVHVWTVNSPDHLFEIAATEPDAITTDYPDRARRLLIAEIDAQVG